MLNLYVIGCGGIGGYLIDLLPRVIASLSLDCIQQDEQDISRYLKETGDVVLPCIVDRITLVDGDTFNPRNAIRQAAGAGSKLASSISAIKADMLNTTFLRNMNIVGFNDYLKPENMADIIPAVPRPNIRNARAGEVYDSMQNPRYNSSVIFIGVDNIKTRYEISRYAESLQDCIIINGGNSKTTGHVTIHERAQGRQLDPYIQEMFPNLLDNMDLRPDERPCTDIAPEHDQIALTNSMIANIMLQKFVKWVRTGLDEPRSDGIVRYNEVLVDVVNSRTVPLCHKLKEKQEK